MVNQNSDTTQTTSTQAAQLSTKQLTIAYWSGEEPTDNVPFPCPKLNEMPAAVDVVMLAFGHINSDNVSLNFDFLTKQNDQATILQWIQDIKANGTKVLLSILGSNFSKVEDQKGFARNVQQAITDWNVDGVDIDYEPPYEKEKEQVIDVVNQLRTTLGPDVLMTAPIYGAWSGIPDFLKAFAEPMDFLTTMDYSSYPGLEETESLYNQYVSVVGNPDKIAIGVSCMNPDNDKFTPVDDVITLCEWKPDSGNKRGTMLYTFSYDMTTRTLNNGETSGTGYANFTFINTIISCLAQQ